LIVDEVMPGQLDLRDAASLSFRGERKIT